MRIGMPTIGWAETRYTGSHRARRDGDRSGERHRSTDTLGCALHDPDGVHRSPRVDVLSVSGCGDRAPARQRAKNLPRQARPGWTGGTCRLRGPGGTGCSGTLVHTVPFPGGSSGRGFPGFPRQSLPGFKLWIGKRAPNCKLRAQPNSRRVWERILATKRGATVEMAWNVTR